MGAGSGIGLFVEVLRTSPGYTSRGTGIGWRWVGGGAVSIARIGLEEWIEPKWERWGIEWREEGR